MNKDKQQMFELVFFSSVVAIMLMLQMTGLAFPTFIPGLPIGTTILHIPVIIGAIVLGRKYAWALGLIMGLMSFWTALRTSPGPGTIQWFFLNPVTSVGGRVFFGFITYEVYHILKKTPLNNKLSIVIVAAVSSAIHTITMLVLIAFFAQFATTIPNSFMSVLLWILRFNGTAEVILGIILVPAIAIALFQVRPELSNEEDN